MGDYKNMIDNKSRDVEPRDLKLDASKNPYGYTEEALIDPQALEAYLKFLETEFTDPAAEASPSEPDEPTNGWPGLPFL